MPTESLFNRENGLSSADYSPEFVDSMSTVTFLNKIKF